MTDKQIVFDLLERLPDEATLPEIARRIEFLSAVRHGLDELDRGNYFSLEDVEKEMPSWVHE